MVYVNKTLTAKNIRPIKEQEVCVSSFLFLEWRTCVRLIQGNLKDRRKVYEKYNPILNY